MISLNGDSMLDTSFIVIPQFDCLHSVEPDDPFPTGFHGLFVKLFLGLHGDEGTKCSGEGVIFSAA